MENTKLTIGAIITLVLAISGTYLVADGDTAYYCEDKDMVMICEKLSSGLGTRCYYEDTYKICKLGWGKVEVGQEIKIDTKVNPKIEESTSGKQYICSPVGCEKIS